MGEYLLQREGFLSPEQARGFLVFPVDVPEVYETLLVRLTFQPDRMVKPDGSFIRNLLTLTIFDPNGFRGAGHRHNPRQEIVIGLADASPGFLPGPLPRGRWIVEVDCHAVLPSDGGGVEYWLEVEAQTVSRSLHGSTQLSEEVPTATPVESTDPGGRPDAPVKIAPSGSAGSEDDAPPRWLKGDLHVHSNHSDGRWTASDIVTHVRDNGLDFIALTDHNTISARDDLREALHAAGLSTVVVPAMELTTFFGHANALGVTSWIDWRVCGPEGNGLALGDGPDAPQARTMAQAAAEVRRLGGTFVVNHPRSEGYPACTGCRWEYGDQTLEYADVVEVMNGRWDRAQNDQAMDVWDRWLNAGHRIPATAGTDSHGFARHPQQLGYTYVNARPEAAAILEAVRAGRSYMSRGPSLIWVEPEPHVATIRGQRLTVQVGNLDKPADLRFVADGEMIFRRRLTESGTVSIDLADGFERAKWYRAELYRRGKRDLVALTNPVYREF